MLSDATKQQDEAHVEASSRALEAEEQQDCPTPQKVGELGWSASLHGIRAVGKLGVDVAEHGESGKSRLLGEPRS